MTDIPIFGLLTKPDLITRTAVDLEKKEREFLECLGINADTSYSRWQNSATGNYSFSALEFMDKLLSPDIRYVLDEISVVTLWAGDLYEKPIFLFMLLLGIFALLLYFLYMKRMIGGMMI